MLNFKYNILYLIVAKRVDNLKESIESCLSQENVNPFIFIACNSLESFREAKLLCKKPIIYEPTLVVSKNMIIIMSNDEKSIMHQAIKFGVSNSCKYYCMCFIPAKLNNSFSKKSVEKIKDDVIGCYSNVIDSGSKLYTNITSINLINFGPVVFMKKEIATAFNHENVGDFLRFCVINGCFYHFDDFLVETQWIKFI